MEDGITTILGAGSYEGLPPEVGAFNSQKRVHAPWPVHNLGHFWLFFANLSSRGVGVIPGPVVGWLEERWLKFINWMPPTMREIRLAEKGCQVNMDGMS